MAKESMDSKPRGVTLEHLEAQKREFLDELAKVHKGHAEEREELKARLASLEEHIKAQKEAESKRDEVKDNKTTLVLPPDDIPPQQIPVNADAPQHQGEKKSFFKRAW